MLVFSFVDHLQAHPPKTLTLQKVEVRSQALDTLRV